jgi:hypothetical protein
VIEEVVYIHYSLFIGGYLESNSMLSKLDVGLRSFIVYRTIINKNTKKTTLVRGPRVRARTRYGEDFLFP